nr:MAG TPA: tail tape measure protein [Caudoviricetes sp.]
MASSFGGTVKLQGESEYRKAIKDITSNLRLMSSELKLTNTQFSSGDKSLKQTKESYENTNKAVQEQKEKISELRIALTQAEKEYGSNNEKVKTFKTQLNNAENQLRQMEDATDKSTKELKEMKNEMQETGNGAIKLGDLIKSNLISEGIISGFKGLVGVVKSVGSALLNTGKSAIDSYANYEQLIGGVETLFKDSSGIVENYANNAYKTAGLSANDYMETVTSFSASLLQSLKNDTSKSAEVADMAITDMADNANKMGTDMSMIQSAYQGFAKQNYTMLDNLKLGYGGTKSEMERLLKDAQKISGVKYNISNLSDIYNAIHIIQGELGVTGTTAKEASTTIQGSVASMKSAWGNLLTGIADENADWNTLVNNFVDSVKTAADNILPRVEETFDGISLLITDCLGMLLDNIVPMGIDLIQNLIDGMVSQFPDILASINNAIGVITKGIVKMLPQIIQLGLQIILSLVQGIAESLPTLIPQIVDTVLLIVDTLLDNIDLIIDAGIQLLIGLADGLIEALPDLIDRIPEIIDKIVMAISNNLPKIIEAGVELIVKLAWGIVKSIPNLVAAIPKVFTSLFLGIANYYSQLIQRGVEIIKKIKDGLVSGIKNMPEIGKNLVKGIWNGIKDTTGWILDKIKGFGKSVLNGIKSIFGIHSPSTVFRDEIGTNLAKGIGIGFENEMENVNGTIQKSLPTDLEFSSNLDLKNNSSNMTKMSEIENNQLLVSALQEALEGMAFKVDGDKFGELVIKNVERVVYS